MPQIRIIEIPSKAKYYDRFIDFIVGSACYVRMLSMLQDPARKVWQEGEPFAIYGKMSNAILNVYPGVILQAIIQGVRPPSLLIYEIEDPDLTDRVIINTYDAKSFVEAQCHSLLAGYFDSVRADIEVRFGRDTSKWPATINFGRVVRNSMSHGGVVCFTNQNASPVTWRGISLDPSDNGRPIHDYLAVGDMINLIIEIEGYLS